MLSHPQIAQVIACDGRTEELLDLVGVAGDLHGPAVEGVEQRHIPRAEVGLAAARPAIGAAGGHQHRAASLVPEVELHLLEGTLDQERREGMRDGAHSGQGEAAGHPDHQLFADAHVDDAVGISGEGFRTEVTQADVGEHQCDP